MTLQVGKQFPTFQSSQELLTRWSSVNIPQELNLQQDREENVEFWKENSEQPEDGGNILTINLFKTQMMPEYDNFYKPS